MQTFFLNGEFSIKNFTELSLIINKLNKNTKIDYSKAKLDFGCKIILQEFNSIGELKNNLKQTKVIHQSFFKYVLTFFFGFFYYMVSFLKFFAIFKNQPKYKFQREIMFQDLINSCYTMGVQAVTIISFLSFCFGVVLALEGVKQLEMFGAEIYAVDLIVFSFFKELSLFLALVVLAARSSSSIIARIGVMRISDEWNTLQVFGLDPNFFLLLPKVLAFIVLVPFLSYISCFSGIFGGYLALKSSVYLNKFLFFNIFSSSMSWQVFFTILFKGPIFGLIAGIITAYEAQEVKMHSENMVFHITRGVILSIFASMFVNMLINIILTAYF